MEANNHMELTILVCGTLVLVLVATLFQYLGKGNGNTKLARPPGRTGWPLIGESIEFLRDMQNMHAERFFFKRMAKYSSPVFKTSVLGDHYMVLCGIEGSKFLFSNSGKLLARKHTRIVEKLFFPPQLEVALDTYMKPAFFKFLKGDCLNNSIGVMDTMAQRHVQSWQSQEITMYPSVKRYLFALAMRLFLSIEDPEMVEKLFHPMEILAEGMVAMPINLPGTRMNHAMKAAAELKLKIRSIVKHQRSVMESNSTAQSNLLFYLMQAHHDDDVVTEGIMGAIVGSFDTVSSVITMTFKVLTDYPEVYDRVYQENKEVVDTKKPGEVLSREDTQKMKYTLSVISEVMRFYPVAPFISREATADFMFAGFLILKGQKLLASTYALHKDPKYFPDPEKFDPSRFDGDGPLPYTYIPFGGGSFMCTGRTYGQIAVLVFVHNVIKRFKWKSMIPNEKIDGIPLPAPAKGLPLHLYPHTN